jgi:two-component system cell cycle response regulator
MRVLIADDSPTPRLLLKRELERLGHECLVAEDGLQAWEMFQGSGVDAVISDWMMPGLDGDELCRRVRADADAPYAYFVLLTSLDDKRHIVAGMEAGADDYLTKPFGHEELETRLIAAMRVSALHRKLRVQQAELARLNQILFDDSRRDALTALGNRRAQDEELEIMVDRAERYGASFCVALFDVDRFKAFNDSAGHLAGDDVLRTVAATLAAECRSGDAVYRYGGEEVLVVLPAQDLESARLAAERMRAAIEGLAVPHPGIEAPGIVTVSGGVASFEPDCGDDVAKLLKRADAALYEAKEGGRNRVAVGAPTRSPRPVR